MRYSGNCDNRRRADSKHLVHLPAPAKTERFNSPGTLSTQTSMSFRRAAVRIIDTKWRDVFLSLYATAVEPANFKWALRTSG
jgi:hypothetical protein